MVECCKVWEVAVAVMAVLLLVGLEYIYSSSSSNDINSSSNGSDGSIIINSGQKDVEVFCVALVTYKLTII